MSVTGTSNIYKNFIYIYFAQVQMLTYLLVILKYATNKQQ
jgi:hypothetical protein